MKAQDYEKLEDACVILDKEGHSGFYDGEEAHRFWDAIRAIEWALKKVEAKGRVEKE
jgi:hypothetical protein